MADKSFKIIVERDNSCRIEMGEGEKLHVLSELKKCYVTMGKMSSWLDDNSVPMEQRERYMPMFQELLHTYSFIWDLLKKAGTTDQEIRETIEIPF